MDNAFKNTAIQKAGLAGMLAVFAYASCLGVFWDSIPYPFFKILSIVGAAVLCGYFVFVAEEGRFK